MSSLAGCIKTLVPTKRQKNIKNDLNALSIDLRKDTTSKKESDLQAVIATIAELNEEKETIRKAILAKLKPQSKVEESNGKEKKEGRKGLLSNVNNYKGKSKFRTIIGNSSVELRPSISLENSTDEVRNTIFDLLHVLANNPNIKDINGGIHRAIESSKEWFPISRLNDYLNERYNVTIDKVVQSFKNIGFSENELNAIRYSLENKVSPYNENTSSNVTTFDSLPEHNPSKPTMTYAGIGSRKTPAPILALMKKYAKRLEQLGYTLRSGHAEGADKAFESGVQSKKEIFLVKDATDTTRAIAKEIHPVPQNLKAIGLDLMARNTNQIFGVNLDTPVDFVLVWTPDGIETSKDRSIKTGGSGQAIDMANRKGIPVFNLANPTGQARFEKFMKDKTSTELAQSGKEGVPDITEPTQQMNTKEDVELATTDEATRQDPESKPTQQTANNDELKLQAMKLNNRIEKLYELLTCLG